jgi:D-3-phosphoglycerate dehydrogenase
MKKILFVDEVHPILAERLTSIGFTCEYDYQSTKDEIEYKINEYFGLVIRSRFPVDKKLLQKATGLKFIARSGSGLENIDLETAKSLNIKIFNSPEGNATAVAEHALGMLLTLFNKICIGNFEVKNKQWNREKNRGIELEGKTIGIIGYGVMGSAFAKRLQGFNCSIIAHDKYKSNFGNTLVSEVNLNEIFNRADIVSLHLPQTEETFHYVDDLFIEKMKKPFYLINTARGKNVSTKALVKGLKSGKISGACLDVLEYEKSSFENLETDENFNYLCNAGNVLLTPHVAGWTVESYFKLSDILADKIENWLKNNPNQV